MDHYDSAIHVDDAVDADDNNVDTWITNLWIVQECLMEMQQKLLIIADNDLDD